MELDDNISNQEILDEKKKKKKILYGKLKKFKEKMLPKPNNEATFMMFYIYLILLTID